MKSINFLKQKGIDVDKSLEIFGDIETYNNTIGEFLGGIADKLNNALAFNSRTKGRERIIELGLTNDLVAKKLVEIYKRIKS